jgi:putative ABC transport system ATP-binding protein
MPLIELEKVHKKYHLGATTVHALRGIDLTIGKGEFVAVWGPSGSGKSTLCNLIGTVDTATSGHVRINGHNVLDLTDDTRSEHRNRSVGFVFQRFNLLPVLNAIENVMLPMQIRGDSTSKARKAAEAMLVEVGLEEYLHTLPDRLSGGQQQRVAIARALVTEPPIVIADEPTANLDTESATRIVELMRRFNRTKGATFIFSTHDQRLLDEVGRRINLRDGHIVEDRAG